MLEREKRVQNLIEELSERVEEIPLLEVKLHKALQEKEKIKGII